VRKGILAQWRRGILARGLAGACLLAVPVAVAAAIGFGTSISGITGGLSAIANGPAPTPTTTTTTASPSRLSDAVAAIADPAPGGGTTGGGGGSGGGTDGGGDLGTTNTGGGGADPSPPPPGEIPDVPLPSGGGNGGGGGGADDPVANVLEDLDDTVSGLLGSRSQ
jgi:hypothetical protein